MLDERVYEEIVGLIYDAAVEPPRLLRALEAVVRAVNAAGAHLVGFDKASQGVVFSAMTGFSALSEIDYNERYAKSDPRAPVLLAAPVGTWNSCHQFLDQAFVDSNEFFQDFLIPYGSRYMSAVKLLETDAYVAILGLHSSVWQSPLQDDALAFLTKVTPHLQRAMRLIQDRATVQDQWTVAKATLDMLDYGALVCDETGTLLVGNEAAASTLEQSDGLSLKDGRLFVRDRNVQTQLRAILLGKGVSGEIDNSQPMSGAILVPRPSALPYYQVILRKIVRERSIFGFKSRDLWSVMISDPARASVPTMRAISVLYDLTPAESRIASLLVAGATPDEVATQTKVKITTIRSQLSSLYSKTRTRRQAELVRLFSTVPALREIPQTISSTKLNSPPN
jgi:DNA-binding CsgD family transcriptional regulator